MRQRRLPASVPLPPPGLCPSLSAPLPSPRAPERPSSGASAATAAAAATGASAVTISVGRRRGQAARRWRRGSGGPRRWRYRRRPPATAAPPPDPSEKHSRQGQRAATPSILPQVSAGVGARLVRWCEARAQRNGGWWEGRCRGSLLAELASRDSSDVDRGTVIVRTSEGGRRTLGHSVSRDRAERVMLFDKTAQFVGVKGNSVITLFLRYDFHVILWDGSSYAFAFGLSLFILYENSTPSALPSVEPICTLY